MKGDWKYGNEAWKTIAVFVAFAVTSILALLAWAAS